MSTIVVEGGKPLVGTVRVAGSKNSALKLIAAALFSNEDVVLENVPRINNLEVDIEIIRAVGGKAEWVGKNKLVINGSNINTYEIPFDLGSKYRTAALHAASLVYRFGKAVLPIPGGCAIGLRPMNRWVDVWESLGIKVEHDERSFYLDSTDIKGANINFKINTHMGTDNAILFSMFAKGETVITNAAQEPEVNDLIELVNLIGVDVKRVGARRIKVVGTRQFSGASFKVQSDRNAVVTYAIGALISGGNVTIKGADRTNLLAFTNVLTKMGAKFEFSQDELRVWRAGDKLSGVDVTTAPYPGFMTDWQPLITLLLTQAEGESLVHDTVYWDRFGYTKDLNRMGADIKLLKPSELGLKAIISEDTYDIKKQGEPETIAKITGLTSLKGAKLHLPDLRAGATLVLAALMAEGRSEIIGFENVSRGYEDFITKLNELGANISVVDSN